MSELADPIEAGGSAAVVASAVELGLIESLSDPAARRWSAGAATPGSGRRLKARPESSRIAHGRG
jgi:hypothetical protein